MYIKEILIKYGISSPFGERVHPITGLKHFHNGIDIPCPMRTPIAAHTTLKVENVWIDGIGGLQMKVSDDKYIYGLAHLDSVRFKPLETIRSGEVFAFTGASGRATGAHLHLTIREKTSNKLLNPAKVLILLVVSLLLLSCSAARHIDKAVFKKSPKYVIEYTISKYGSDYLEKIRDTIIDTIFTKQYTIDTLIYGVSHDTIIVEKDKMMMKVFKYYDSVYVFCRTKADTIYQTKYITKYIAEKPQYSRSFGGVFYLILFIVFLILLFFITIKVYSNVE